MKKFLLILVIMISAAACQDESRQELMEPVKAEKEQDSIPTLTGEIIFVGDAAVFRGDSFVYGVTVDSMAQALSEKIKPYQKEDFDMVSVKIKGKIVPSSNQEGWEEDIEIREIIEILETEKVSDSIEE
ncbi:MAG: hypothetical protein RI572_12535 [Salegentibacter sp.]|uniref:NlpE C-terminal OB domain-containing protein n=1 Tax=Salegentibacter flavus TaxID=287099 RepID=A0A1I4ZPY5_9FLAO|nr:MULTISPECIES: hypothetical protein [Salegentibacter]MDR9458224.1 hypothetical protein [Salegentibacter sp.]SFN52103.1 hypothetical protein SAMN05660413_01419 [Salegentibacter flavus]